MLRLPRADYGVVRIDPLRFLTGWRKRRLNQALSVLSLSLGFLSVLYCCLVWPLFVLHWFVFCPCSISWLLWFGCHCQCKWLTAKTRLRNGLWLSLFAKWQQFNIKYIQKKKNKMHNTSKHYGRRLSTTAHSLTVFSLIPVWFVMANINCGNDWILLPCYVFVMFITK